MAVVLVSWRVPQESYICVHSISKNLPIEHRMEVSSDGFLAKQVML